MSELTLSQALARIEAKHKAVAGELADLSAAEWSTPHGYELCNRETELITALLVLLELAADNAPEATPL